MGLRKAMIRDLLVMEIWSAWMKICQGDLWNESAAGRLMSE